MQNNVKHGSVGSVDLSDLNIAVKKIPLNSTYWIRELYISNYLDYAYTDTIIKTDKIEIFHGDGTDNSILFHMNKCKSDLHECVVYRDCHVFQVMLDLTSALGFLHSCNLTHRDIKPANILINDEYRAILTDFSASHITTKQLTRQSKYVVTNPYKSPELFKYCVLKKSTVTKFDQSIDLWSLGIVLAEMVTNTCRRSIMFHLNSDLLFDNTSELQMCNYVNNYTEFYSDLKTFYSNNANKKFIHADLYFKWITQMLQFNPKDRISTGELFKDIIRHANLYNINIILPSNTFGEFIPNFDIPNLSIEDKYIHSVNKFLLHNCNKTINGFIKMYSLNTVKNCCSILLNVLINDLVITEENYIHYSISLLLIVETIIFDNVIEFNEIDYLNHKKNATSINEALCDLIEYNPEKKYNHGLLWIIDVLS